MAVHVLKFVDSIAASPTTRLDVNDGTIFSCTEFDASPPRLRRAMSQNAMSDGGFVSGSQFEMRIVKATLLLNRSTQDLNAAQLQLLARELDRADNYLMFQPNGLTKPVFFRTVRSDFTSVREVPSDSTAARFVEFECLCEPFALGLRESLGPFTVNNDPAASNGHYFDVTGVIGDVATDCVVTNTGTHRGGGWLAVRQHGTPADMDVTFRIQAEAFTPGTDTTNPGGGPDAAMSGTGTNNYLRTTFATATALFPRMTYTDTLTAAEGLALIGEYRVLAVVRRTDTTSVMTIAAAGSDSVSGETVTIPLSTDRQIVDLGVFSFGPTVERVGKYNSAQISTGTWTLTILEGCESGSGDLDLDYVQLVPADESCMVFAGDYAASTDELVIDGPNAAVYLTANGVDPFASTATVTGDGFRVSGGFSRLVPGRTNRFVYVAAESKVDPGGGAEPIPGHKITKGDVGTVSVDYWPAYLYVRPSAT